MTTHEDARSNTLSGDAQVQVNSLAGSGGAARTPRKRSIGALARHREKVETHVHWRRGLEYCPTTVDGDESSESPVLAVGQQLGELAVRRRRLQVSV